MKCEKCGEEGSWKRKLCPYCDADRKYVEEEALIESKYLNRPKGLFVEPYDRKKGK
jgi:hypothetical protein